MITYIESSVFESPAQTLVNTVNIVGVMGKGIAKEFKSRYPKMYSEYRRLCDNRQLNIGQLHLWRSDTRWILNFPTKTTWRRPSELSYVEAGLAKFVSTYKDLGITSASFPPLGCGNGNLDWNIVRPIMDSYLSRVDIPIYIHDIQVSANFVPEHREMSRIPVDFFDFSSDIRALTQGRRFATSTESQFRAFLNDDNSIVVEHETGKRERIDSDLIESSWVRLREKILSFENFSDEKSRRLKSYLFPILVELPYICRVRIRPRDGGSNRAEALFLDRDSQQPYANVAASNEAQGWLFQ